MDQRRGRPRGELERISAATAARREGRRTPWAWSLLATLAVVGAPSTARADLTWTAEVVPGEATAQQAHPPPAIRVKVLGEPLPSKEVWGTFVLKHDPRDVRGMAGVAPVRAIPYHRSTETLGIVVLVEGHEYYFGNATYKQAQSCTTSTPGQPCRIVKVSTGVAEVIRAALTPEASDDGLPSTISRAGPPGSKGALIVYSSAAEKRYEGDLADLTDDKLGDEREQEGKTSRDLVAGLELAQQALARMGTNRKALFVFSDGFDAGGGGAIRDLKRQLDADHVEVFAFYLTAATELIVNDPATTRTSRKSLDDLAGGRVTRAADQDALRQAITAAVLDLNSRFTLVFPGQVVDPRTKRKSGFVWDEREHELQLARGDEPIVNYDAQGDERPVVLLMAPRWGAGSTGDRWWLWIAIPIGVVALGVGAATLRRQAPAPRPAIGAAPTATPAPVTAAPPNPARTMMVNIASDDGLPVVGWLVPVQGERQFQTFKLQYGETRIGTTPDAHIVLHDGFMSTDHARVVMSPTGFTLIDNGSTNGTFANERRVQRHELVDNDVIVFGKTACKFKTILGT